MLPSFVVDAWGLADAPVRELQGGRSNRTLHAELPQPLVVQHLRAGSHDDLLGVMENLVRVTSHLRWKQMTLADELAPASAFSFPDLVPTAARKPFLMTDDGDVWRAFAFRPGVVARAERDPAVIAAIGHMYGRFTAATHDLGGPALLRTTAGFHDLDAVVSDLVELVESSTSTRREDVAAAMGRVEQLADLARQRCAADGLHEAPERVVHNDTKLSNALLDERGTSPVGVLDLDLVMPGPVWHDVGDLVRSASWHLGNDEQPVFVPDVIGRVMQAYLAGTGHVLAPVEIETFACAGPRLSLELGVRYLSDHLRDEPVLRVAGPDGHLRRGLGNLSLAEEMFGAYDALRTLVDGLVAQSASDAHKAASQPTEGTP